MADDTAMFSNGVTAIELGIEDYRSDDPRRASSAVRNFYSGVILLIKERLFRLSPELVAARVRPVINDGNKVIWEPEGKATADFQILMDRWKSLKLSALDWGRLKQLQELRNDLEHRAPTVTQDALREAVANTFVLLEEVLSKHLNESPPRLFDTEVWDEMRSQAALHKKLSDECRDGRERLANEHEGILRGIILGKLSCDTCGSALLRTKDESPYPATEFECVACGEISEAGALVESSVKVIRANESRYDDDFNDTWGMCPSCFAEAYLIDEDCCLVCLEVKPFDRCIRCDEELGLDEQDNGICGYCAHMTDGI